MFRKAALVSGCPTVALYLTTPSQNGLSAVPRLRIRSIMAGCMGSDTLPMATFTSSAPSLRSRKRSWATRMEEGFRFL